MGEVGILNVGAGDTKITFDPKNPAELIRSGRIIKDMLRRGYALLVEVERDGEKRFERALDFDESKCEYIIADLDPTITQEEPDGERESTEEAPSDPSDPKSKRRGGRRKGVPAASTRAVSVGRSAGG